MDDLAGFVAPRGCALGRPLILAAVTGSTNDDARRLAGAGCGHGTVVLADRQTAGRGRLGRTWHAEPGENLSFSIVWREGLRTPSLGTFALAAGLGVAEALDAFVPSPTTVKWPNDVRVGGHKVAGLLAEAVFRGDVPGAVIVGVGINVRGTRFPEEIAARATSLALASGRDVARADVLAAVLLALDGTLGSLARAGFGGLLRRLVARCDTLGSAVRVGAVAGVAEGIDAGGALLVRDAAGELHAVTSGEVC